MRVQALAVSVLLSCARRVVSQSIQDIYATKWDKTQLFSSLKPSPINFDTPGAIGDADITIDDSTKYQEMAGFGGTLSPFFALHYPLSRNKARLTLPLSISYSRFSSQGSQRAQGALSFLSLLFLRSMR
jgi:hypothetical protein